MSSAATEPGQRAAQERVLDLYSAVTVLMLLGIAVLIFYAVQLGPITAPGVQESFGLAVALMFIMAAIIVHLVDRTYRVWPLGRRFRPTPPGPVTEASQLRFLKILVVVVAAAAIAYVLGGLIT